MMINSITYQEYIQDKTKSHQFEKRILLIIPILFNLQSSIFQFSTTLSLASHLALSLQSPQIHILYQISFLYTLDLLPYSAIDFLYFISKSKSGFNIYLSRQSTKVLHKHLSLSCIRNPLSLMIKSTVSPLIE